MDLLSEQIPIKFMKTDAHITAFEKGGTVYSALKTGIKTSMTLLISSSF